MNGNCSPMYLYINKHFLLPTLGGYAIRVYKKHMSFKYTNVFQHDTERALDLAIWRPGLVDSLNWLAWTSHLTFCTMDVSSVK